MKSTKITLTVLLSLWCSIGLMAQCTLTAPSNLAITYVDASTVTLSWDAVPGAVGYQVSGHKVGASLWGSANTTTNSYTIASGIPPGNEYEWNVTAFCGSGLYSPASAFEYFFLPPENFVCGDPFLDIRDGQVYNTMEIGGNCWMTDNANFNIVGPPGHVELTGVFSPDNVGGYYWWSAAKDISDWWNHHLYSPEGEQGVCPVGWHVSTDADWQQLLSVPGIDAFDLIDGGSTGFDIPMMGYLSTGGSHQAAGLGTIVLTSSEAEKGRMWAYVFQSGLPFVERAEIVKVCRGPVRCVKD